MKPTQFHKGDPIFNTQLLEHSSDHGAIECLTVRNVVISCFCAVLQCVRSSPVCVRCTAHTAHMSVTMEQMNASQ